MTLEQEDKRRKTLIKKYGSWEKYQEAAKGFGKKGGSTGGNGLQKLTFEERSRNSRRVKQLMKEKLREEVRKEVLEELADV